MADDGQSGTGNGKKQDGATADGTGHESEHPILWPNAEQASRDPQQVQGLMSRRVTTPSENVLPRSINVDLMQHILTVYDTFAKVPDADKRIAAYLTIAYFVSGGRLPTKPKVGEGEQVSLEGAADKIEKFREVIKEAADTIFGNDDGEDDS